MDYYDGNTVTGLWNYAQHYAMSDNSFDTDFGPSTPGALNLVSGQTHGVHAVDPVDRHAERPTPTPYVGSPGRATASARSSTTRTRPTTTARTTTTPSTNTLAAMTGQEHRRPAQRARRHLGLVPGRLHADHAGTASTALRGLRRAPTPTSAALASPTTARTTTRSSTTSRRRTRTTCRRRSVAAIGHTDQANHEYDLTDFDTALRTDNLPAVSFLKAAGVPGRPRRLLRPARRAALPGQRDQRDAEVAGVEDHRDRHRLRRLRRLVRPRVRHRCTNGSNDPPATTRCAPQLAASAGRRRLRRTAAAPARGCRCWSSRPYSKINYVDHTPHRAGLDPEVHRGQLAHRPDR